MSVCPSVRPSVCLSVRHRNPSASQNPVYLLLSLHLDLSDDLSDISDLGSLRCQYYLQLLNLSAVDLTSALALSFEICLQNVLKIPLSKKSRLYKASIDILLWKLIANTIYLMVPLRLQELFKMFVHIYCSTHLW